MNLILSDVEETITIVDIDEAGGESVRVRFKLFFPFFFAYRRERMLTYALLIPDDYRLPRGTSRCCSFEGMESSWYVQLPFLPSPPSLLRLAFVFCGTTTRTPARCTRM